MVSIISEWGHKNNVYEYTIDTFDELEDVPTDKGVGSVVFCIENSKTYMLNGSGVWVEVNFKKGGKAGDNIIEQWDFVKTQSWVGEKRGIEITSYPVMTENGVSFPNIYSDIDLCIGFPTMGCELDVGDMNVSKGGNRKFLMAGGSGKGFVYRSTNYWGFYDGSNWQMTNISATDYFANSIVKLIIDNGNKWHIYKNDELVMEPTSKLAVTALRIGDTNYSINNTIIKAIRII